MGMPARKLTPDENTSISPLEALREMQSLVCQDQPEQNLRDIQANALEGLKQVLEYTTLAAFDAATAASTLDELHACAIELGKQQWEHWGRAVALAQSYAEKTGQGVGDLASKWIARVYRAHILYPHLPSEARVYYRAAASLMADAARGEVGKHAAAAKAADPKWPWSTPLADVKPCVLAFHALQQLIAVAGNAPVRLSAAVVTLTAQTLLKTVAGGIEPKNVKAALDAARALEERSASAAEAVVAARGEAAGDFEFGEKVGPDPVVAPSFNDRLLSRRRPSVLDDDTLLAYD